ncbi:MAG: S-adenosyl-l-methionine hydroxide adenosyltransferase family protein [Candidatus Thermoplasmatota archaeon]|jgi:S-adenosylmethionine hydrolase|nr:S-adenosyl-l-methionine hydroxide adenosyltransferase family protein [Candidatus Thermoplasmatota archaeon]
MKIITLLTDFGSKDGYVAQIKGVISFITDARIIDITHDVTPHNIREAAFILRNTSPYYPIGTVHLAVVDPGVGTDRKGLIITTKSQILIGPDNGVLIPAAKFLGDLTVYEIKNNEYMLKNVSNTFHGRDIFAPIAAHIVNGVSFDKLGDKTKNFVDLDFGETCMSKKDITGKVVYLDHFGNIITNIDGTSVKEVLDYNKKIKLSINNKPREAVFVKSYGFTKKGQLLATIGSSNYLEISINQGNAAQKLNAKPDDKIKITF